MRKTAGELISLRRTSRHSIDSDKTRARGDTMDANKIRVRDEFDNPNLPGHTWVTACRTIENYVQNDLLSAGFTQAHRDSATNHLQRSGTTR
jgi:hypothetical protein